jgi:hypothetical protein
VRFEETLQRWGTTGHIHQVGPTSYNVNFYDCELSYDRNGTGGGKTYQLLLLSTGGGPVRIRNSQILDMSDSVPTDTFGASAATAPIEVSGLLNGNGVGDHTVAIPARYLGAAVGDKRHSYGSAAPVTGTWYAGDVVWATDPAAVKAAGWVAAVNGTPGTWRTVRATHENAAAPSSGTWALGDITWNNSPDPGEPVGWVCTAAGTPGTWFPITILAGVSGDRGDTDQTLTVGDHPIQRWASTLTANRTITLSTTGAVGGSTFRVVRTGLGAFTLDVGGLRTIPSATAAFVDVAYNGSAWVLTAYGTL